MCRHHTPPWPDRWVLDTIVYVIFCGERFTLRLCHGRSLCFRLIAFPPVLGSLGMPAANLPAVTLSFRLSPMVLATEERLEEKVDMRKPTLQLVQDNIIYEWNSPRASDAPLQTNTAWPFPRP